MEFTSSYEFCHDRHKKCFPSHEKGKKNLNESNFSDNIANIEGVTLKEMNRESSVMFVLREIKSQKLMTRCAISFGGKISNL